MQCNAAAVSLFEQKEGAPISLVGQNKQYSSTRTYVPYYMTQVGIFAASRFFPDLTGTAAITE